MDSADRPRRKSALGGGIKDGDAAVKCSGPPHHIEAPTWRYSGFAAGSVAGFLESSSAVDEACLDYSMFSKSKLSVALCVSGAGRWTGEPCVPGPDSSPICRLITRGSSSPDQAEAAPCTFSAEREVAFGWSQL